MTVPITPVDNFDTSINIPAPGEAVTSAAIALGVQSNADRSEFIFNRVPACSDQTSVTVPITLGIGDTVNWEFDGDFAAWAQTTTGIGYLRFDVTNILPRGAFWRSAKMFVAPVGGHGAFNASDLPVIAAHKSTHTDYVSAPGVIIATPDPSANNAEYELDHTVETAPFSEQVLVGVSYQVAIVGELPSWGVPFSKITAIEIGWTI